MQTISPAIQFKASKVEDSGEFSGHGSVFGNEDLGGDIVMPGAFQKSLANHKTDGTRPAMLWSHDTHEPIGTWTDIREDDIGLAVKGRLILENPKAKTAHSLMKDGGLGLSIGYEIIDSSFDKANVRQLKEVDLWEISPVVFPMNRRARITAVKSLDIRSYETLLREELGCSRRDACKLASGGWPALTKENGESAELEELAELMRELKTQWSM